MSALKAVIRSAVASVELAEKGETVTAPVAITTWEDRSPGMLAAQVTFGPYPNRVNADTVLLRLDGEVEPVALPGRISLPAGVRFSYDLTISVSRD